MTDQLTIRWLNDTLRSTFLTGKIVLTQGVACLPPEEKADLLTAVRTFDAFTEGNDPHGEHDFGSVDQGGVRYFWKIDYYDTACEAGSSDPADPTVTTRVLTIMRADEY